MKQQSLRSLTPPANTSTRACHLSRLRERSRSQPRERADEYPIPNKESPGNNAGPVHNDAPCQSDN